MTIGGEWAEKGRAKAGKWEQLSLDNSENILKSTKNCETKKEKKG